MVAQSGTGIAPVTAGPLVQAVAVESISGGESTSPLWVSKVGNAEFGAALNQSLQNANLRAPAAETAKYDLRANLITLSQPMIGLDMTVKSAVKYTLVERATKRTVYDDIVSADHTATFGDSALGVERLRMANEGSIRKNIETFLRDVVAKVRAPAPTAPPRRTGS